MRASAALLALLVAACAGPLPIGRPALELPEQWLAGAQGVAASAAGERWWNVYGDARLDALIEEAFAYNADLQAAAARVLEARALAGIAQSDRYPVVSAGASADRTRSSGVGTFPLPPGVPQTQSRYRATLDASYEVDLWGRLKRGAEAAEADALAAAAAREAAQLSLGAQLAQLYFALLAADEQEAALRRVLATRGETVQLFRRRLDAGLASELDLRQAQAEEASARSQLAGAVQSRERQETALALLLGRSPRAVLTGVLPRGAPSAPTAPVVPDGLPADLLLRRPDLREAEQRLIAADARIEAARARYFPAITLTGFLGSESARLGDLFSGPAGIFQFAGALVQPIFNAGRLRYETEAAQARRAQAEAQYRGAVAAAFGDVRTALAAQTAARETLEAETARSEALREAQDKVRLRYDAGIASRLEVLDIERQQLQSELARIDAERARRAAIADLFKALGGGWAADEAPAR